MIYNILVGGRGAEAYVHNLTPEQTQKLVELGDLNDGVESDQILEAIEKEFFDDADENYVGAYDTPDSYQIVVTDENGKTVFQSDEEFYFEDKHDDEEDYIFVADENNTLIVEDCVKGCFFKCKVEVDGEFDITKLTTITTDVGEYFEIITGLKYDGEVLEKEFDDYFSKGLTFHLFE